MTNLETQLMRLLFLGRHYGTKTAESTIYIKIRDELSTAFDNGEVTPEELLNICQAEDREAFFQGLDELEVPQGYLMGI